MKYTVHTCAHGRPYLLTSYGEKWDKGLPQTKWVCVSEYRSRDKAIADAKARPIKAAVMKDCVATIYDNGKPPYDNPHHFTGMPVGAVME